MPDATDDVVRAPSRRGRWVAALLHAGGRIPGARLFTRVHARLYRGSGGRVIRRWFGAPVLVLEVKGRRTGVRRDVSVVYLEVDDGYLVTAANAGNEKTPQWWRNLRAAGAGVVHVAGRRERVRPRLVEGVERERLWARLVDAYPSIAHYTRYTNRTFPLVVLHREDVTR